MPKNTTLPCRRSIRRFNVTRNPISELCEIIDFAQVDGEARILVRLDQLVKPVALAELPVGGVSSVASKATTSTPLILLGCEFEHACLLSRPKR